MLKLKQIIAKGIEQTAPLFSSISVAYNWIHRAASILENEANLDAIGVKRSYRTLLAQMSRWKHKAGSLESGITQ